MAIKKESKRGPKHKPGYTKNQILLLLCNYPDGIEEPELREIIKTKLSISRNETIKDHLKTLERKKKWILKKPQKGKENVWFPKLDIPALQQLFQEWHNPDIVKFHRFPYCQGIINSSLLREIEKRWNITASYKPEKEFKPLREAYWKQWREKQAERGEEGISDEDLEYIYSDDVITDERGERAPYYLRPDFFTEEDILEILKFSPTALKKALEGTSIKEKPQQTIYETLGILVPDIHPVEQLKRSFFEQMLLASIVLDSGTIDYAGYIFTTEQTLKINIPGRKDIFYKSSKTRNDHELFNRLFPVL